MWYYNAEIISSPTSMVINDLKYDPSLFQDKEKLKELGAHQKAIIFTESRRTQSYLHDLLENNGFKGKIALFNGTNNDEQSKYQVS